MRISVLHGVSAAALAGVVVATMSVAQASTVTAVPPPTTDSGDLSTSPSTFFVGDSITIIANFADSQSGKVVTFLKETSPGSGGYEPIGERTANSSGNASLAGYTINAQQKVFARTSAGKATEIDTLTPSPAPGGDGEIKACFDRDDGDLNILIPPRSCTSTQRAISWDTQTEPAGTVQAFQATTSNVQGFLTEPKVILSKEVPAGNYAVTATLNLQNPSRTDTHSGVCSLDKTSGAAGVGAAGFGIPAINDQETSELESYGYTIIGTFDAGDGTTLELICQGKDANEETHVISARIVATSVSSIG